MVFFRYMWFEAQPTIGNMTRRLDYHLTLLLLCALLSGCREQPQSVNLPRPVRAMRVKDDTALAKRWLPGRARAAQEVNLAFRVSGPLIELKVAVGDEVKKGETVARIDPRDFQVAYRAAEANLASARAQLRAMQTGARPEEIEQLRAAVEQSEARVRRARNDMERAEQLIKSRNISQADYDQFREALALAEAELRHAREALRIGQIGARPEDIEAKEAEIRALEAAFTSARNQLNDTVLRAPFDGVVVARNVDNFQQVRAEQPIMRLLDVSRIEMVVNVPEPSISLVPYVTDVECMFDAFPNLRLKARVSEIGSEASRTTRTYPVTLLMDQPEGARILPGMAGRARGRVKLPDDMSQGWEIPESAIFERNGQSFVWVIDSSDGHSGRTLARQVKLGELSPRGLRVVEGVQPGELIATAGVEFLQEGQTVRVLDQS